MQFCFSQVCDLVHGIPKGAHAVTNLPQRPRQRPRQRQRPPRIILGANQVQVHFPEIPKSRNVAYDVFIYILSHSAKLSGGIDPCVLLGGWRRRNGGGGREGEEDEEEEEEDKGSGRGKGKSLNAPSFYS